MRGELNNVILAVGPFAIPFFFFCDGQGRVKRPLDLGREIPSRERGTPGAGGC